MEEQEQEIGVKEAVRIATGVMQNLYSDVELRDLLLEEVEKSGRIWLVTMGFTRPGKDTPLGAIMAPSMRAYKRIRIDAETGEFLGMEIRQLPTPQSDGP